MLCVSLRLVGVNIYFYDVFLIIKRVQKGFKMGYIEMRGFFYCEIHMKVHQIGYFYTTIICAKMVVFEILLHVVAKMVNIWLVLLRIQ